MTRFFAWLLLIGVLGGIGLAVAWPDDVPEGVYDARGTATNCSVHEQALDEDIVPMVSGKAFGPPNSPKKTWNKLQTKGRRSVITIWMMSMTAP